MMYFHKIEILFQYKEKALPNKQTETERISEENHKRNRAHKRSKP